MDAQLVDFIPYLKCPISGGPLREMQPEEIQSLNLSIKEGNVRSYEGDIINRPLREGLINAGKTYVYPVIDSRIAALLPGRGISLEDVPLSAKPLSDEGKKTVMEFYDQFGWKKDGENSYNDTITFEDRRPVSQGYWSRCHLRLNKYFSGGEYMLDVASGAIPNDEYLTFSDLYNTRICMDFSIIALQEAALRLKGKGLFIMGDMTNIPIVDDCVDAVISMHTVYHVPQHEQTKAVAESYRVLKEGEKAVIVYSWKNPPLMKGAFKLWRPLLGFYKSLKKKKLLVPKKEKTESQPALFVNQQDYNWFANEIKKPFNARLEVYSAISRSFSHTFLKEKMYGRQFASFIYRIENLAPSLLGRWGQYPVFILQKKKTYSAPATLVEEKKTTMTVA